MHDSTGSSPAANKVVLARFRSARRAHEYGLVVLSCGASYWIERGPGGYYLLVDCEVADAVREQLRKYRRESRNWPPREPVFPEHTGSWWVPAAWVAVLVISHLIALRWPGWVEWGKVSAHAVMAGDFWRIGTALLLHADISHLSGNALMGAFFLAFLVRQIRPWQALVGTFAAGALGNLANVVIYYPQEHLSIGASTAVFGCVAMLISAPLGIALQRRWWSVLRTWAIPLIGGIVLLAWFGAGGANTDVTAHLTGFFCGLPLGLVAGYLSARPPRETADAAAASDGQQD